MGARKVVVTGVGAVSAIGRDCGELEQSLREGRCGLTALPEFVEGTIRFPNAGIVRDFPGDRIPEKLIDQTDRFCHFLIASAAEAVAQAGITADDPRWRDATIITGTGIGGEGAQDSAFFDMYRLNKSRVHPFLIPKTMPNAGASHLSMIYGVSGQVYTVSTACSSGNHAIGLAWSSIASGSADLALAGGSEGPVSFGFLKAWEAMRVVSPNTCRPFSKDRAGLVLGEGGGILVLESEESANARGAVILAELAGFGMSADAFHLTLPSPDGAALAMERALHVAGVSVEEIDYINAHGTGTAVNDPVETRAIRKVFGPRSEKIAVSSSKSMHGHVLGGAGAVEAVATILAMKGGFAPPTANFTEPDPECDLDYVPNRSRPLQIRAAISNSFAFGGLNAVLVFRNRLN